MSVRHLVFLLALAMAASSVWAQNAPTTQTADPITLPVATDHPLPLTPHPSPEGLAEQVEGVNGGSTGFVARVLKWYDANMNYWAVGALMAIESSFIPFPSEVVIPPAVFTSASPESANHMKIWVIVLIGTLGALLGAFVNYFLSRWLGRPVIYAFVESKLGHLLMLSGEKMERAEKYFNDHGNISTLIGRLVPVVRQLISIPAGLAKMPVVPFAVCTFIGALAWNIILAVIGYYAYKIGQLSIIKEYSHAIGVILLTIVAAAIVFFVAKSITRKRKNTVAAGGATAETNQEA